MTLQRPKIAIDERIVPCGIVHAYMIVDAEDADRVRELNWRVYDGYPVAGIRINGKFVTIRIARFVMGDPPRPGLVIDHINRNKLDNRKSNLRWVTHAENNRNRLACEPPLSKYIKVDWSIFGDRYIVKYRGISGGVFTCRYAAECMVEFLEWGFGLPHDAQGTTGTNKASSGADSSGGDRDVVGDRDGSVGRPPE